MRCSHHMKAFVYGLSSGSYGLLLDVVPFISTESAHLSEQYNIELLGVTICFSQVAQYCKKLAAIVSSSLLSSRICTLFNFGTLCPEYLFTNPGFCDFPICFLTFGLR